MNRITRRWGDSIPTLTGKVVCDDEYCEKENCETCRYYYLLNRLADIEDILGCQYELQDIRNAMWAATVISDVFSENTDDAERLRKLWFADKDGRCFISPVKLGDTVYRCKDAEVAAYTVTSIEVNSSGKLMFKATFHDGIVSTIIPENGLWYSGIAFTENEIGHSVYLTKEAAEAASSKEVCS